jgi:hypothetical protein
MRLKAHDLSVRIGILAAERPKALDADTSYENGAVTRPIFPASWCAPGVLGVSPAKLGRRKSHP